MSNFGNVQGSFSTFRQVEIYLNPQLIFSQREIKPFKSDSKSRVYWEIKLSRVSSIRT